MNKRRIFKTAMALMICAVFMFTGAIGAFADGTHGFFMTCYTDVTDDKTDGFMMDFYSDSENALCTYWSNANWSMYTLPTVKANGYLNFKGGGAYAGFQILDKPEQRRGIMSMWRYEYMDMKTRETKYIYAKAIYGKTTSFSNEGSGTSCVMEYNWKSSQWYRELILCWEDEETGNTFIGNWYYDYEADEWTLFAYYNTFLIDSYMNGDIGQFLENFVESTRENYRSFRYRNIYMLPNGSDHKVEDWLSCQKIYIQSDANPKAHGEAKLGLSEDGTYVWAWVDGRSSVDTDEKLELTATLKQEAKPTVGTPLIQSLSTKDIKSKGEVNGTRVTWELGKNSTPQLSYKLEVFDESGSLITTASGTRPEVDNLKLDDVKTDAYRCELTVTDVFGQTAKATYTSEAYGKSDAEPTDTENNIVLPTKTPSTHVDKENSSMTWVIVACAVAAVVVAAVVVAVVIKKKKK
ncbi:MAG: DUF3472 domain-containing protein [Clostridia bacterium]|nr:DUF3472 domain-containing protein [Clostridia bacterium]